MTGVPASPSGHSGQAPQPASGLGHSASVPNAERPILDWHGLRVRDTWERCIIRLADAGMMARQKYSVPEHWGAALAACCWVDGERGDLKLFVADFDNGRRIVVRLTRDSLTRTFTATPHIQRQELLASAIEARSDATGTGAAEGESAVGEAETPTPPLAKAQGHD